VEVAVMIIKTSIAVPTTAAVEVAAVVEVEAAVVAPPQDVEMVYK